MPELPEVETVRRGLEPVMVGRTIEQAEVRRPDLRRPFPERMGERLLGARVDAMGRRSKYLLVMLDREETLIVHLGMSGRVQVEGAPTAPYRTNGPLHERHDHVILRLDDGVRIAFNDPRRFGAMDLIATDRLGTHPLLAHLGPEPLDREFGAGQLVAAFRGRRTPVKTALLDQRVVAGLGNIYVCEALHRASISPRRFAARISTVRVERLVEHIRETLEDAISAGGSTLRDYRHADGSLGYFQHAFQVYGREGLPCLRETCKGTVRRIAQSGRSSFYCPTCQH